MPPVTTGGMDEETSHTRPAGIIYPPPDIRSIADKTSQFVAKNGPTFEAKILQNERNNPRFAFLQQASPYHAYYQFKLQEFREGKEPEATAPPPPPPSDQKDTEPSSTPATVSAAPQVKPISALRYRGPPPPWKFSFERPEGILVQDLEIMKLTAQFVARNGRQFLTGLTNREFRNPQFDFLKPHHTYFSYFQFLVDSYSKIILPPDDVHDLLQREYCEKVNVLDRCQHRAEWEKAEIRRRKQAADEEDQEREAMAMIDWYDFTVVEKIDFPEDEILPETKPGELAMQDNNMDVDMDVDEEPVPVIEARVTVAPEEPEMKIVRDYKPRGSGTRAMGEQLQKCPRCGELIPISEMTEHMRIELLDPRWKEQKQLTEQKLRETALASDDAIARQLNKLAKRTFGEDEGDDDESTAVGRVTWDGHTSSITATKQRAASTLSEQLRAIEESKVKVSKGPEIGPLLPTAQPLHPPPPRPETTNVSAPLPPPPSQYGASGFPPMMPSTMPGTMPGMMPGAMPGAMPGMMPGMMMPGMMPGVPQYGGMMAQPPLPPHAAPAPPPEEPPLKRAKEENEPVLEPEAAFLARVPSSLTVKVQVPETTGQYCLTAQELLITLEVKELVSTLKEKVAEMIDVPAPKQKMRVAGRPWLKDTLSLAYYNITDGTLVEMGVKERGGRGGKK